MVDNRDCRIAELEAENASIKRDLDYIVNLISKVIEEDKSILNILNKYL